jgi:hypothetical protein
VVKGQDKFYFLAIAENVNPKNVNVVSNKNENALVPMRARKNEN